MQRGRTGSNHALHQAEGKRLKVGTVSFWVVGQPFRLPRRQAERLPYKSRKTIPYQKLPPRQPSPVVAAGDQPDEARRREWVGVHVNDERCFGLAPFRITTAKAQTRAEFS